ncbi:non-ribosomal peptide synthetase [Pseudomonas sp. DSP3-2-2]|uniref:non-ribosomal peptide synthetase n=1 Tax=unclassified Pseudomonas TaxID=196821 RepID=UPI003CFB0DE8
MNTHDEVITDSGLALLAEQLIELERVQNGASWGDSGYFLRIDIEGPLDPQHLQLALNECVQRQPVLATELRSVPGYHGQRQFPGAGRPDFALTVDEQVQSTQVIDQRLAQWYARPLQLATGRFAEALLLRRDTQAWQLVLGVGKFLVDQESLKILFRDLLAAYSNQVAGEEEQAQFAQYLEWRSEVVLDEDAGTAKSYWQAQLNSQETTAPDLPERRRGTLAKSSIQRLEAAINPELLTRLDALAATQARPLEALLQAAWWLLLGRISGREVFVGIWRHDARRDYEFFTDSVGLFEKNLPLTFAPDMSQPFSMWLAGVGAQLEDHSTWQEYLPASVGTSAYGFAVRGSAQQQTAAGLRWTPIEVPETAPPFELMLNVLLDQHQKASSVRLDFLPQRHAENTVRRLLDQYQVLLQSIATPQNAATPMAQLNVSSEQERAALLALNPAPLNLSDQGLLPTIIARWAQQTPDAVALEADGQRLTYAELEVQVRQVAAGFVAQGITRGSVIALALPRSMNQVLAILAAWRAGAAYLPLDPAWPQARRQSIVEQAGASLVIEDAADLMTLESPDLTELELSGADAAYVLFTSGSTGMPKGVVIEHRQLLNYTAGVSRQLALDGCKHFALGSTVTADLGNTTLYGALYNGATLHICSDQVMQDAQGFASFIEAQRIDCLKIVPSHLSALLDVERPSLPMTLVLGGEAVANSLVERILQIRPDCRLFNHYGPTETTVGVMVHPVTRADAQQPGIPLSQVLPNNQVYILDARQQLVAGGELGELYIGGQQLARGYLNAAAGDQAFIANPFATGERLYRSGDLARYRADGSIELYGRKDQQVKVRGFRIELAEIEAQLLQLPEVSEAVVLLDPSSAEPVAFVVAGQGVSGETLKAELALRLPAVMVPGRMQLLERMPRLGNGKVDRQALSRLEISEPAHAYLAPRDALEQLLASRMAQLLGQETLSVDQDFFAAGGHSLLVIKLVAGIRKLLQCEVQPGIVFDNSTPAALALALREREASPGQLETIARARLTLDSMSPEEKAQMLARARQGA